MPRMNLEGSSSIVTGGASGSGEALAGQLAAAGSRVVVADLNAGLVARAEERVLIPARHDPLAASG